MTAGMSSVRWSCLSSVHWEWSMEGAVFQYVLHLNNPGNQHTICHIIQSAAIWYIRVIPCQVNQIFSIQIPEWNFPYVRPR
jgi:hypothetical protein